MKLKKGPASNLKIPPLLLEGDEPFLPPVAGPGRRYELGLSPSPAPPAGVDEGGELPETYGTGRLWLIARDPHTLYASWDFTQDQLQDLGREGQLQLRLHIGAIRAEPSIQIPISADSQHRFVSGASSGTKYVAELGYCTAQGTWVAVSASGFTLTPLDLTPQASESNPPIEPSPQPASPRPEVIPEGAGVRFAALPLEVPLADIIAATPLAFQGTLPLLDAIEQSGAAGWASWPPCHPPPVAAPSTISNAAADDAREPESVQWPWVISFESPASRPVHPYDGIPPEAKAPSSLAPLPAVEMPAVTSPAGIAGEPEPKKPFWFAVNAELVIYGATESDAQVILGELPIRLRPDGTFSCRVALPDGQFELLVRVASADGLEQRRAAMVFGRSTHYEGTSHKGH